MIYYYNFNILSGWTPAHAPLLHVCSRLCPGAAAGHRIGRLARARAHAQPQRLRGSERVSSLLCRLLRRWRSPPRPPRRDVVTPALKRLLAVLYSSMAPVCVWLRPRDSGAVIFLLY